MRSNFLQLRPLGLILLFFLVGQTALSGQTITLDLSALANSSYRITGPGLDESVTGTLPKDFELSSAGVCTLELDYQTQTSARIQFSVAAGGEIDNVLWQDADRSQAPAYVPLQARYYEVIGNVLLLKGKAVQYDASMSPGGTWYHKQMDMELHIDRYATFRLFPGDYEMTLDGGIIVGEIHLD